ncbi:hypothetical protein H5410_045310 [Solanum commersonii]|uniref:Uncharacterized protein n=1 Tax=Solanum commersonii TaxID=4109 RepID=A0A9J5XCD2_SOLCO|nr:hypothetical protein H5410_045310 [Solanum commersonii]
MSNSSSSSNSFNFSVPPPEGSLSTPVCGVGETDESITLHTEVLTLETQSEDLEVVSQPGPVSSTMSERGDTQSILLEQEYRSLELVPHNVQPVFDQTLKSFGVDSKKEEETSLVLHRKGVRGAYALTTGISDLEAVDIVLESKLNEPAKSERKRKTKGKGKLVESHTKEGKRRYVTRRDTQKLMGDALVVNKVQMERNQRQRKDGLVHVEKLTSTPQHIGSSETKSDDIEKVTKKALSKPKSGKGPGTIVQNQVEVSLQSWEHLFEAHAPYFHKPEVREFYYKMKLLDGGGIQTTVNGVTINLNEYNLGIIFGVLYLGIRSIECCKPSSEFAQWATKRGDIKYANLSKKFVRGEY